ncbi:5'/3'-nucleotidase SurE [Carnimonas bestiolae]|uniref:5'/3'-nucleotidase SurE n=1 Tax=Carnimonas bestiolae TaxID=3402172 RepID=UPI003EDBA654
MSTPFLKRILLTNDDGISAPGLKALASVAHGLAHEVWIVAPAHDQSGVATSLSLHDPLRINELAPRHFAVSGTPADCTAIAIRHLMADNPPDLVLSGINRGANLGTETSYSGTVGAALTAIALGVPAIALSQAFTDGQPVRWETAETLAPAALQRLITLGWPSHVALNVNFPDLPADQAKPLTATQQGKGALETIDVIAREDPRQQPYYWLKIRRQAEEANDNSETHCLSDGHITVSPIAFERTDQVTFQHLHTQLAKK